MKNKTYDLSQCPSGKTQYTPSVEELSTMCNAVIRECIAVNIIFVGIDCVDFKRNKQRWRFALDGKEAQAWADSQDVGMLRVFTLSHLGTELANCGDWQQIGRVANVSPGIALHRLLTEFASSQAK